MDRKAYERWLNEPTLDEALKKELLSLDDKGIEDAFYEPLAFGTGGMRGIMGVGIRKMNRYTIRRVTAGFALYLQSLGKTRGVAISYDNRYQSKEFAYEAAKVLAYYQIPSYVYEYLRPTPMLSYAVRKLGLSGGIMITASHNPKTYNGYKVYNDSGAQLTLDEAESLLTYIDTIEDVFAVKLGESRFIHSIGTSFDDVYLKEVKTIQLNNPKKELKIVYSPLHGTGGTVIPGFLQKEGYQVYPYYDQMNPDPAFSNVNSSNPEEKKAFDQALLYANQIDAKLVLITDPDADRLGIAVKHRGEFHLLNGNQTAAILLYYKLSNLPQVDENGYVFTTNVTTGLIDAIGHDFGAQVVTTLTGFKFICEQAKAIEGKGVYLFGCEESYGTLISDFVRDKDAVQACYMLSEVANVLYEQGLTLIDYLQKIYDKYGHYYEYTDNIVFEGIDGSEKMKRIMNHFRTHHLHVEGFDVSSYDDVLKGIHVEGNKETHLNLAHLDVLKYYNKEGNWIVLRPSGTEPKLKVYFSFKGENIEKAKMLVSSISQKMRQIMEGL